MVRSLDSPPSPLLNDLDSLYTSPSLSTPESSLQHQHSGALLQSLLPELYAWADSLQAVQFPETATGPSNTASGASSDDAALPTHQRGQDVTGKPIGHQGLTTTILGAASSRSVLSQAHGKSNLLCTQQGPAMPGWDTVTKQGDGGHTSGQAALRDLDVVPCKAKLPGNARVQALLSWLVSYLCACRCGLPQQQRRSCDAASLGCRWQLSNVHLSGGSHADASGAH